MRAARRRVALVRWEINKGGIVKDHNALTIVSDGYADRVDIDLIANFD